MEYVQGRSYREDLSLLNGGNTENDGAKGPVKKTSPIYKLDPQVKGQLLCDEANAPIPEESKYSLIVPKSSHFLSIKYSLIVPKSSHFLK